MRVASLKVNHRGRVTIYYEGADPMTDYCPLTSDVSQKFALRSLADFGRAPGCHVWPDNARDAGEPWPKAHVKAKRFAGRAGLPFRERVWFPRRANYEDAERDQALEPELQTVVRPISRAWLDDDSFGDGWQAQLVEPFVQAESRA